jgi:hypothetical protein
MIFWVSRPTRSLVRLANVLTMLCLTASLSAAAESQPRWVTNEVEWFGEVAGMGHSPEMWACKRLRTKHFHGVLSALHQKSGQHADPSVNKTFLSSF